MRVFRAVFGPLAKELWIYPVLPAAFAVGAWFAVPGMTVAEAAGRFGVAFTTIACLGLPVHLAYHHAGPHLLPEAFTWRELPVHALFIGGGVLLGTEVALALFGLFRWGDDFDPAEERLLFWVLGSICSAFTALVFVSLDRLSGRLADARTREARARQVSLEAQVQSLQARIQPHFLFNALNTVVGLIPEAPERAETFVQHLADLFRYTLDASKQTTVPLADELAVVEGYLELETLRYGDRLKAAVHADPDVRGVPVPPLSLQPVVENAVLHGIAPRREGGRLEVHARREEGKLALVVEDDGPGPGASSHAGSGTALADLRTRLELLYGPEAGVEIDRGALGGARVTLRLPLHVRPALRGDEP